MAQFFFVRYADTDFVVGPGTYDPPKVARGGYPPEGATLDYENIYLALDTRREVPLLDLLAPNVIQGIVSAVFHSFET